MERIERGNKVNNRNYKDAAEIDRSKRNWGSCVVAG